MENWLPTPLPEKRDDLQFLVPVDWEPKITHEKKCSFLKILADTGNICRAAEAIDVTRWALYKLKLKDIGFSKAWDEARQIAIQFFEAEAIRRATEGVEEPVYHQGFKVGTVQKYSDSLLMFLLKGNLPERYADRQRVEHSGGVSLQVSTGVPAIPAEFSEVILRTEDVPPEEDDLC